MEQENLVDKEKVTQIEIQKDIAENGCEAQEETREKMQAGTQEEAQEETREKMQAGTQEEMREFSERENPEKDMKNAGVGVIEIILILVVLVALVLIFKEQLTSMVERAMEALEQSMEKILS